MKMNCQVFVGPFTTEIIGTIQNIVFINDKCPWNPELRDRYERLVNSLPKSVHKNPVGRGGEMRHLGAKDIMVGGIRVELMTSAMSTQRSKPLS